MSRKDKPPHVEQIRQRLEQTVRKAFKEQPEPRFGRRRTRKPRRPVDVPAVQRTLFDREAAE